MNAKNILPGYIRNSIRTLEEEINDLFLQRQEMDVRDRSAIDDAIIRRQQEYKSYTGIYYIPSPPKGI